MGSYASLKAWQAAHRLATEVLRIARGFPPHERYELTSQLRRAALSVPTNIVEGHARYGEREFLRYARMAAGSLAEVDYLLLLARELTYLDETRHQQLVALRREASYLLHRLILALQARTGVR